jgi:PAS domain S-box-containing protein
MIRRQTSIQRKLTSVIMVTTVTVLLLTGAAFVSYELVTFERWLENYVGTLGEIIADNSSSALRFDDPKAAEETLSTIAVERHIVAAALYDTNGQLFASWPTNVSRAIFPAHPGAEGFRREQDFLILFSPVATPEQRMGTLYMRSDLGARQERLGPYAVIVAIVLALSILVALLLSKFLQRGISQPLLALADTARAISNRRDYSVRAINFSNDEVGVLTDSFNHMLTQIQERDAALRHNEERFRQLANAVPAFVWTCDVSGGAIYLNEPWYEYTGRTPSDSLGFKWTQVVHPEDRDAYVREFHNAVQRGRTFEAEARFRRFDDEYRWFLSRAHPLRDPDGHVTAWFGSSIDIEEKRRAEDKISEMNVSLEQRVQERTAQLEASNRELEAFSYSVAHDLRAPLRSIDGFNQALLEDHGKDLPQDAQELMQRARQASQRMSQLIDDLLNLSRVARAEMRRQHINLSEIANSIAAELQKNEPTRAEKVVFRIQPGLFATGDDRLLRLVLENLIGNAFKFTRHKPQALIEFGRLDQDGKRVLFVRDNGAGFKMEYAGKLFGPFQRLHATTEYPGTGIGLATVHRILMRHGGKIWPESEEGKGATFYFTLPE